MKIKASVSGLGRKCPSGKILRSGYTTKRGVRVRPSCVVDTGAPGKTPPSKRVLPKPEPGALRPWAKDLPLRKRRQAAATVSRRDGCVTAIRKLTLLRNLTADKATERAAKADADWLRRQDFCKLKSRKEH